MLMANKVLFVLLVLGLAASAYAANGECTACPCLQCSFLTVGNYFKDCGGDASWGEFPAGSAAIVYEAGCQTCSTDRLMGRLTNPDHSVWGFFPKSDLSCHSLDYAVLNMTKTDTAGCRAPGDYKVTTERTLRPEPAGLVCGTMLIGEGFTLSKCDPSGNWCYGQGHGVVCNGQTACTNCLGWIECDAF